MPKAHCAPCTCDVMHMTSHCWEEAECGAQCSESSMAGGSSFCVLRRSWPLKPHCAWLCSHLGDHQDEIGSGKECHSSKVLLQLSVLFQREKGSYLLHLMSKGEVSGGAQWIRGEDLKGAIVPLLYEHPHADWNGFSRPVCEELIHITLGSPSNVLVL